MILPLDVIIAARDYGRYLPAAIDSALAQDDCDVRVTVVDDHSEDDTADVVASYRDRPVAYLRLTDGTGLAAGRNLGVRATDRPLVAFLDADDVWPSDRTRTLAELLAAHGADLAHGRYSNFPDGTEPGPSDDIIDGISGVTVLHRREALETVGPMDESLPHMSYPDWLVRARGAGLVIAGTPEIVTWRRVHDVNASRAGTKPADMLAIVRRHLRSPGSAGN